MLKTLKSKEWGMDFEGMMSPLQPVFRGVGIEVVSSDTGLGLRLDDRQDWSYSTTPTNTTGIRTESFKFLRNVTLDHIKY